MSTSPPARSRPRGSPNRREPVARGVGVQEPGRERRRWPRAAWRLNPGGSAKITFFAPVGLLFFFFVVAVLAAARWREIHLGCYFLLSCAFFAFHLLFAYLVDHLAVGTSFAIASVVSVFLVVSYARLFVGWRFALREMGIAQAIYLVLFSFTFFWTGFTGLAITLGAIVTLFVIMQITGKVDWKRLQPQGRGARSRRSSRSRGRPSPGRVVLVAQVAFLPLVVVEGELGGEAEILERIGDARREDLGSLAPQGPGSVGDLQELAGLAGDDLALDMHRLASLAVGPHVTIGAAAGAKVVSSRLPAE